MRGGGGESKEVFCFAQQENTLLGSLADEISIIKDSVCGQIVKSKKPKACSLHALVPLEPPPSCIGPIPSP